MRYFKYIFITIIIALSLNLYGNKSFARGLEYYKAHTPQEVFAGGDEYKLVNGKSPVTYVYKNEKLIGYTFITTDFLPSIGYSGKPIKIIVGIDLKGTITGAKIIFHEEPIILAGIAFSKFQKFVSQHIGLNVYEEQKKSQKSSKMDVDIISGATVTSMVVNDAILRAGRKLLNMVNHKQVAIEKTRNIIKNVSFKKISWSELIKSKLITNLRLSEDDINNSFAKIGAPAKDIYGEYNQSKKNKYFLNLYTAIITPEFIGKNLLGVDEYKLLTKTRLKKGQQAILIAANGAFSFRGSGYVRGGIFDRFVLVQGENTFRFRDHDYKRIGEIAQKDAPHFNEIGVFIIPQTEFKESNFDPAKPWYLEILVSRHIGAIKKIFTTFSLGYSIPKKFLEIEKIEKPKIDPKESYDLDVSATPLWQRIWHDRMTDVIILSIAIILLTIVFFIQDVLVKYPVVLERIRIGFLLFAVFWIGGYAQAQISIVNVLAFINSLLTGFKWDFFLMEPLIFLLWSAVAVSLLFWGRGAFCGWLCPFGALQELLNRIAKKLGVKQLSLPFTIHQRLWSIKYMIFLGLLALSLYSLGTAEVYSEVEPFKTTFLLKFDREWPFVLYAALVLGIGLFNERFFCRYLCPLGAALAIPARNRLFRWLKRRKECGTRCSTCANNCMVQAIEDDGKINPNECLYCLDCQVIYYDKHKCLPLIEKRLKHEKRKAEAKAIKKSEKK